MRYRQNRAALPLEAHSAPPALRAGRMDRCGRPEGDNDIVELQTATLIGCCRGLTESKTSKPWPEDDAYGNVAIWHETDMVGCPTLSPLSAGKAYYMCSERLFWRAAVKERKPLTMATSFGKGISLQDDTLILRRGGFREGSEQPNFPTSALANVNSSPNAFHFDRRARLVFPSDMIFAHRHKCVCR